MLAARPTRLSANAYMLLGAILWVGLFLFLDTRPVIYDEGIILTGAREVLSGAVPHRDFYVNYGPAQFYVLAGLFKLFGTEFLVARAYDTAIRAGIVVLSLLILRRCRPAMAFAAAGSIAAWLFAIGAYGYPVFPSLLLALAGTGILLRDGEAGRHRPAAFAIAGALTGLVALFRYEVGLFVLLAHLVGIAYAQVIDAGPRAVRLRRFAGAVLAYGIGTGATFLPAAVALLAAGAGPGFLHDMVRFPSTYYASMRHVPPPGLADIAASPPMVAVYLPFLVTPVALVLLAWCGHRTPGSRTVDRGPALAIVFLAALCAGLAIKGLVRISPVHLLMPIVISTLLLAVLLDRWGGWPRPWRYVLAALGLVAVAAPAYMAAKLAKQMITYDRGLSLLGWSLGARGAGPQGIAAFVPGMASARVPVGSQCAIGFVRAHTGPDDRIFVGNMRHDRLFANHVEYYFEAQRRPGTRWYHFDPGLQTRADIQRRMIEDLDRNDVRWVIRDSSLDRFSEPNMSAISSGVFLLDRHLRGAFRPVAWFDQTGVWVRRDVVPAPSPGDPRCAAAARASATTLARWQATDTVPSR